MKKKIDLTNNKQDVFYKLIYPVFTKEFLFGDNLMVFSGKVNQMFALNQEQWDYIKEHWDEKQKILHVELPKIDIIIEQESGEHIGTYTGWQGTVNELQPMLEDHYGETLSCEEFKKTGEDQISALKFGATLIFVVSTPEVDEQINIQQTFVYNSESKN